MIFRKVRFSLLHWLHSCMFRIENTRQADLARTVSYIINVIFVFPVRGEQEQFFQYEKRRCRFHMTCRSTLLFHSLTACPESHFKACPDPFSLYRLSRRFLSPVPLCLTRFAVFGPPPYI